MSPFLKKNMNTSYIWHFPSFVNNRTLQHIPYLKLTGINVQRWRLGWKLIFSGGEEGKTCNLYCTTGADWCTTVQLGDLDVQWYNWGNFCTTVTLWEVSVELHNWRKCCKNVQRYNCCRTVTPGEIPVQLYNWWKYMYNCTTVETVQLGRAIYNCSTIKLGSIAVQLYSWS